MDTVIITDIMRQRAVLKCLEFQRVSIIPIENIIKETREVEVLHNLIKNNGQNFEITNIEKELAEKLSI